jgi:ABC-type branched-subunit amino acid transport system substrate-binding protein
MMMKRILFLSLALAGCKSSEPPAPAIPTIVLGQDIDRTGSMATPSWANSIRLAVNSANLALKQEGRALRFEVAEANSGNSPEHARTAAIQLVKQQRAKAIITDSSQDDIAVNALAYDGDPSHELDVPVVCMACTTPDINNPEAEDRDPVKQAALRNLKGWNFRTTMSSVYQVPVLARMLLASSHGDRFKLSIYASDDPYGRGFSDALKTGLLKVRPRAFIEQVYHDVNVNPAEYDWAADVAKAIDNHNESTGKNDGPPDTVVEITFPKFAIGFTKAFLASGSKVRLVHTHNFRVARVLETLKGAVEDQEGTSQAVLGEGSSAQVFAQDLKALTGEAPAFRDSGAYDAATTLMLAALFAAQQNQLADPSQVTGAQIRDAMRAINNPQGETVNAGTDGFTRAVQLIAAGKPVNYQGASGPCDYDAHGDVVAHLARFQVQGGRFADVERFDCVRNSSCPAVRTLGNR